MKLNLRLHVQCGACGAELWVKEPQDLFANIAAHFEHLKGCPNADILPAVIAKGKLGE
jgi:hypothetical protein